MIGGITFFIIIAIIVIAVIGTIIYIKSNSTNENFINPEIEPVNQYVNDCLLQVAKESVNSVSVLGGKQLDRKSVV